ncbi:MAG: MaoC family dehydratase [Bdellovibrionales bacterium]|nr:MaoC family dehydratase [Bdellovibrionales bacterium]
MKIGDIYTEELTISATHIQKFAEFSGDFNPVHFDDEAAIAQGFKGRIAHGMVAASHFSKIFANEFPGAGTIYLNQTFTFLAPVYVNDTLSYKLEVMEQKEGKPIFTVKTEAFGVDGKARISGVAIIRAKIN